MATKEVRGVLVHVGKRPVKLTLTWSSGGDLNARKGFSAVVEKKIGIEKIERAPFPFIKGTTMMIDVDGKLKDLKYNRLGVCGPFFVCGWHHGSFQSLTDADANEAIRSLMNKSLVEDYEKAYIRYALQQPVENETPQRRERRERLLQETRACQSLTLRKSLPTDEDARP